VVKERLHFRFEAELSPIHRSTSTVHYRVFKRRLAGASLFKGGVHVRTTTTCTLSATQGRLAEQPASEERKGVAHSC